MLDKLAVAEVSALHLKREDWLVINKLAAVNKSLSDGVCEAWLNFAWFDPEYSVLINLGRVHADIEDDRLLDHDVYKLLLSNNFSTEFADLIIQARREEFTYLVIDPEKELTKTLPKLFKELDALIVNHYNPDHVSPPGATIKDLMEENEIRDYKLAELLEIPLGHLYSILNGEAAVADSVAERLQDMGWGPKTFWLKRQANYAASKGANLD